MKTKNIFYLSILLIFVMFGCSKEKENSELSNSKRINNLNAELYAPPKPRKKIKLKAGTHFSEINCGLNLYCGPCPGFCIVSGISVMSDNEELTNAELNEGFEVLEFEGLDDESATILIPENNTSFVRNDTLFITDNISLSSIDSDSLGYQNVTILSGNYPKSFNDGDKKVFQISILNE